MLNWRLLRVLYIVIFWFFKKFLAWNYQFKDHFSVFQIFAESKYEDFPRVLYPRTPNLHNTSHLSIFA